MHAGGRGRGAGRTMPAWMSAVEPGEEIARGAATRGFRPPPPQEEAPPGWESRQSRTFNGRQYFWYCSTVYDPQLNCPKLAPSLTIGLCELGAPPQTRPFGRRLSASLCHLAPSKTRSRRSQLATTTCRRALPMERRWTRSLTLARLLLEMGSRAEKQKQKKRCILNLAWRSKHGICGNAMNCCGISLQEIDYGDERIGFPKEKPTATGMMHGWLTPPLCAMLKRLCAPTTNVVVELGAWLGCTTKALCNFAPEAYVYAVDFWDNEYIQDQYTGQQRPGERPRADGESYGHGFGALDDHTMVRPLPPVCHPCSMKIHR
eukprot:SAG31_NODE_3648_length_4028_cov_10.401120_3_plen_318_part_00